MGYPHISRSPLMYVPSIILFISNQHVNNGFTNIVCIKILVYGLGAGRIYSSCSRIERSLIRRFILQTDWLI